MVINKEYLQVCSPDSTQLHDKYWKRDFPWDIKNKTRIFQSSHWESNMQPPWFIWYKKIVWCKCMCFVVYFLGEFILYKRTVVVLLLERATPEISPWKNDDSRILSYKNNLPKHLSGSAPKRFSSHQVMNSLVPAIVACRLGGLSLVSHIQRLLDQIPSGPAFFLSFVYTCQLYTSIIPFRVAYLKWEMLHFKLFTGCNN